MRLAQARYGTAPSHRHPRLAARARPGADGGGRAARRQAGVERSRSCRSPPSGDMIQDRPLAEVGGKALWTKELDRALLEGRTDSQRPFDEGCRDDPPRRRSSSPRCCERADTGDRLIGADSLAALPNGARVGTSSPRRAAQLLARRPDLEIAPIRGNVQTRLAKIERGEFDATLLAAAGLDRLGLADRRRRSTCCPRPRRARSASRCSRRATICAPCSPPSIIAPTHGAVASGARLPRRLGRRLPFRGRGACRPMACSEPKSCCPTAARSRPAKDEPAAAGRARLLDRASPALRAMFGR